MSTSPETSVQAAAEATIKGLSADVAVVGAASEASQIEGAKEHKVSYVVHGAQIACFSSNEVDTENNPIQCGQRSGRLIVPKSHGVYLRKKAQLNKMDCLPNVNLQSCGVCGSALAAAMEEKKEDKRGIWAKIVSTVKSVKQLFFPTVKSKEESKRRIENMEHQIRCNPIIVDPEDGWKETKPDVFIEGQEALLNISYLICARGGTIRIINDGQQDE